MPEKRRSWKGAAANVRRLKQTWIAAALGMSVWMTACAGAASETATQEGAVDEESQGAIREAVTENDQAQEQPERDKTQEIERTEPLTVEPVRETLNMTHFDNCTFAAGFKPQWIQRRGKCRPYSGACL